MRRWWAGLVVVVVVAVGVPVTASAAGGVLPVPGPVVGSFDPPEERWGAGHRGVDLAAAPGASVVAPAAGVVSFVGMVAGRPVVVVDHGATRSTLEPVTATVAVGARVAAGEVVGSLVSGHPCAATSCLHWGLKQGADYLDPLGMLGGPEVRLLPDAAAGGVRQRAAAREAAARAATASLAPPGGTGPLSRPAAGRVTSVFGPRFHPIFHEWRLHAGIDLSAPCGTPLHAAADGVVSHQGYDSSGGWRLVIDHGSVDGTSLQTVYLHAQGYTVRAGERVSRGQVVGAMGTTGWSTGCHLHFGVKANGRHVDPQPWLG